MASWRRYLFIVSAASLASVGATSLAAGKKNKTSLAEQEAMAAARVNPGYEIPQDPDKSKWRTTGKINGKVVYPTSLPLYTFEGEARGTVVGDVPLGKEIKMDKVKAYKGRHYYGVEAEEKLKDGKVIKKMRWVDGFQLERN